MASAGWLAPGRPEVYRPKSELPGGVEPGTVGRIIERMRPDEGWVGLPLVLVLAATMAWSIADSRWILGQDQLTSFLIWIALAAASWGYVSARLDLSPWLAHALGCTIGAFILIEAIGSSLPNSQPGLVGWFSATATSVTQAYLDLTWRHQVSTLQVGHFCLILGIVVWGTAQAASYLIFGYHRAVNGVLLLAVVLIANMALTLNDQYTDLVLFSAAALVLLLLAHAADERSSWLRHRIWRGRDFQAPHLQGGLAFASAAVVGALLLTLVASSAPLQPVFNNLGDTVQNAFGWMGGYLPNGGASRYQATADFGTTAPISSSFHETTRDIFTVRVPSGQISFHWRLVTYDSFQTTGWTLGPDSRQDQIIAGGSLDAGTNDLVGPTTPGRRQVSIQIHVQDTTLRHLIVANEPDSVNAGVQRTLVGVSTPDVAWLSADATDYTVSAFVPALEQGDTTLTEWMLQHAGKDYPAGIIDRYTQGAALVGSDGKALLNEIQSWAHANGNAFDDEYDVAKAIQTYLHGPSFVYNTDITGLMPRCTGLSTVDCFAFIREGFCEQYATTMSMLMRMEGYPARYVLGYLPGAIDPHSLVEQVTSQQKHAWVEVYFPTYGWIPFDPTGGGVGEPTVLQPGSAVTSTPSPLPTPVGSDANGDKPSHVPASGAGSVTTTNGNGPVFLLVPAILLLIIALALFVWWRRRTRHMEGPDAVYRNVVRLASRLGYKPAPTQTVYEYTGMLADLLPQARESLGIVAMATVEVTYGKQQLSSERLVFLATAHRLVRQALLRLALRMPKLRGRRHRPGGSVKPKRRSVRDRG